MLKEPGTDIRSSVTGGTQVVSDWLIRSAITAEPGRDVPGPDDRPGRGRQAPEDARTRSPSYILLAGLTIIFLLAVVTLQPFAHLRRRRRSRSSVLVALLVCLIPTTIGGLLSAIGIAGMDRVTRATCWR